MSSASSTHINSSSIQIFKGLLHPWRWDPIGYPETSLTNYQSTLSKIPEKRRSHSHRSGSLKLRVSLVAIFTQAAHEPDHRKGCVSLPKVLDAPGIDKGLFFFCSTTASYRALASWNKGLTISYFARPLRWPI
jgi:hypothetical protein